MMTGRTMSPECVMEVVTLITHALTAAGDPEPLGSATALAIQIIERIEQDVIERRRPAPTPSLN
jgi:hypothetical protein